MNEVMRREMDEAILTGQVALETLKLARDKLNSASNWGMFDVLGGGLFGTMMKHSRIDEATSYMESAKRNLQLFKRELSDVDEKINLDINIGSFLSFADFFFDGLIADMMVQSKINDAKEQVNDAICHVEWLLAQLRERRDILSI